MNSQRRKRRSLRYRKEVRFGATREGDCQPDGEDEGDDYAKSEDNSQETEGQGSRSARTIQR